MNIAPYLLLLILCFGSFSTNAQSSMRLVAGGSYQPLYGTELGKSIEVRPFYMDETAVSQQQFLAFVQANPQWQRSKVKRIFADERYLDHWLSDTSFPADFGQRAITQVSWFAAKAYCECLGKRLPTLDEWEYAALASSKLKNAQNDSLFNQYILRSYERPNTNTQALRSTYKNYWGLWDMHGLVWEWVHDFQTVIITGESRGDGGNKGLFCASGAVGASDLMNYAAFMRYAMRSSVKARQTFNTMGFRCVSDVPNPLPLCDIPATSAAF